MTKEAICTGKTVEEALEKAYAELGVTSDHSEFEIMERPKRSLFGLRVTPARVRVFMEVAEAPAPRPKQTETAPPPQQRRPAPRPERAEGQPAPKLERPAERPYTPSVPPSPPREMTDEGRAKMACAAEYLRGIFRDMGLGGVELATKENGAGVVFTLSGDGLGVLIGRRGETLDALQYLAGLVANRLEGEYFRITIDSGNYREKREKTLAQLARKLSMQVVKTGRNMTLEPMNPYERRIIHATVQEIDGVTSSSIGEEPNRRVVISSTNPRKPRPSAPRSNAPRDGAPRENVPRPAAPRDNTPHDGAAPRDGAPRESLPRPAAPRDNAPQAGAPRSGAPRDGGNRRPGGFGGRGGRPRDNSRGPGNVSTRPNPYGHEPVAHIDDSAYQIEPPARTAHLPEPTPKGPATVEEPGKALYSKIEIDD